MTVDQQGKDTDQWSLKGTIDLLTAFGAAHLAV
jgi:hypothetical protein